MSAGLIGNARTSNTTSPASGAPTSGTSAQRRPSSGWPYRSSSICFIPSSPSSRPFQSNVSRLFEVDPLVHRQPLEMAAQAVEPHLAGTQAHPLAPAENAAASGIGALGGRDRPAYGAAEVDPVGAVVEIDQHRQRVARAGVAPRRSRHRFRRLAGQLARRRSPLEADAGEDLGEVAGPDAATEDLLRARERH